VPEVADLYVTLRAVTSPFVKGMGEAAASGESMGSKIKSGPVNALANLGKAASAGALAVGVISVKMAGDFQASMVKLKTSAGETGDIIGGKLTGGLKLVSDGLLKMAVETGTSTKELAAGMYVVESAGKHGADGLTILKVAAEGARAEGAPLKDVTNALTTAMNDFNLKPPEAARAMNTMTVAVGQGKMNMADFAAALPQVSVKAHVAGISFGELTGAMATLTQHGTTAREASFELAAVIRGLNQPNLQASKEMDRLGLSAVDVSKNLGSRGLMGTLEMLTKAIAAHTKGGQVLIDTFNKSKTAAGDANLAFKSLPPDVQRLAAEVKKGSMTWADYNKGIKALGPTSSNLGAQWETAQKRASGFSDLLRSGSPLAQSYSQALAKMTGGQNGLNAALQLTGPNLADAMTNIGKTSAAWNTHTKTVKGFADVQKTFNFQMSQAKEVVETTAVKIGSALIPKIEAVVGWFQKHKDVTKAASDELKRLAGVVGTIAGAIGSVLLPALKWTATEFEHHKILGKALADIIGGVLTLAVLTFAARSVKSIAMTTKEIVTFGGALGKLKDAGVGGKLVSGWDTIRLKAMYAGEGVKKFGSTIADLSSKAGSGGMNALTSGWDTVRLKAMSAGEAMGKVASAAKSGISTAAELATKWSKAAAEVVIFNLRMAAYLMWQGLVSAATKIWTGIQAAFNLVMDMNPIALVVIAIAALVAGVIYAYTHFKVFRDIVNGVFEWLKAAVMVVINFVTDHWRLIITIIGGPLGLVVALVTKYWSQIWSFIQTAVRGVLSAIGWIARVPGQVAGWFGQMATAAANKAMGLVNWMTGLPGAILRALGNTGSILYNAGKNIIVGLINGIDSAINWLTSKLSWVTNLIPSWKGPMSVDLKLLEPSGQAIMTGLVTGITSQLPALQSTLAGVTDSVSASFSGAGQATIGGNVTGRGSALSAGINANVLGAGVGGAGATVIHNETHIHVAGSVLAEHELLAVVQKHALRQNRRNPSNGLSLLAGF
jgi:TP901 family phage tail tape measure protein